METILLSTFSMILSIVALFVSILIWRRDYTAERYSNEDIRLTEIHEMEFDHPELRVPDWCKKALDDPDPMVRAKYDAFASIVWNFLESLYDRYGEKELLRTSFEGAVKDLAKKHETWFILNMEYYTPEFVRFIKKLSILKIGDENSNSAQIADAATRAVQEYGEGLRRRVFSFCAHPRSSASNYILLVVANDGRTSTFDVSPYLKYQAFEDLRDPKKSTKIQNGSYFVEWECDADFALDTIEAK